MLLDEILNATTAYIGGGSPIILSENNDLDSIDFEAALQDPAELAKLASRRGMTSEAYLRWAAQQRASLDTTGGKIRVMVAGKPAWHKLGVNVAEAVSSGHAIRLAGLDWKVIKLPMGYAFGDTQRSQDEVYAIVREDTGDFLGAVGSRYQPIQNMEGFEFLDSVIGQYGARYESAGSLHGGKQVWMLVNLPRQAFSVGTTTDKVEAYACFTNPHDGSGSALCYPTSVRIECANTLRVSTRDKSKGIRIRHTGNIKQKIADAQQALGLAVQGFEEFRDAAQAMNRVRTDIHQFVIDVLDRTQEFSYAQSRLGAHTLAEQILGATAEAEAIERERKRIAKKLERRESMYEDILARYESERSPERGTAWACLNAVTEHADYQLHKYGRQVGNEQARAERRMESVLTGEADELKQVAYGLALASVN